MISMESLSADDKTAHFKFVLQVLGVKELKVNDPKDVPKQKVR